MRLESMYQEVILDHYRHPNARDCVTIGMQKYITTTPHAVTIFGYVFT